MKNRRIVVFSGAGMSAESGISTFRDSGGLWENVAIEDVATPDAWKRNPERVQSFYNERRKQILESQPNKAHQICASLEELGAVDIITQNIDDLHERAGSKEVLHLHGNIRLAKSSGPNAESTYYPIKGWELKMTDRCTEGYSLRPHVVWFGEEVPELLTAEKIIQQADIFIVIGTSLQVYPAAGLIYAVKPGTLCYLIDPQAHLLQAPSTFNKISNSASEGLTEVKSILENKS